MQQQDLRLSHYLRLLWKGKWLILLSGLVALGGVLGFTFFQEPPGPSYQATATIAVEPVSPPKDLADILSFPSGDGKLETQIQIIGNVNVLEGALEKLQNTDGNDETIPSNVKELKDTLTIREIAGTNLLNVISRASTLEQAQSQAEAVVESYREQIEEQRTQAMAVALADIAAQLRIPEEYEDLRDRAIILLPAFGDELADIAKSLGSTTRALDELRRGTVEENARLSFSLESLNIPEILADLNDFTAALQNIQEKIQARQDPELTQAGSTLNPQAQLIDRTIADLGSISQELKNILKEVTSKDSSPDIERMADRADEAAAALSEAYVKIAGLRLRAVDDATSRGVEVYLDSTKDQIRFLAGGMRRSIARSSRIDKSDQVLWQGQVRGYSLGLAEAANTLKEIREDVDLGDVSRITSAEGHLAIAREQIRLLTLELEIIDDTQLTDGLKDVLSWVQLSSNNLRKVSLDTDLDAFQQGLIEGKTNEQLRDVSLPLSVAVGRLRNMNAGPSEPLLQAKLGSLAARLFLVQEQVAGSLGISAATPRYQEDQLVAGFSVVEERVTTAGDSLQAMLNHAGTSANLASKLPELELSKIYADLSDSTRSLDIASRQLRGLLRSVGDPLLLGELGPLAGDLDQSYRNVVRSLELVAELGYTDEQPRELNRLQGQMETAISLFRAAGASATMGAATLAQELEDPEKRNGLDFLNRIKEQTDTGVAILGRVADDLTVLSIAETDLLKYGRLTVLQRHVKEVLAQATEVSTQLEQVRESRGPINVEMRELHHNLELAILQPQDTGITLVGLAVAPQGLESTFFKEARIPLGAVAGLLLGSIAVVMKGQTDRTVRTPGQLRDQLGMASLGVIPRSKVKGKRQPPMISCQQASCFAEALQVVGSNLSLLSNQGVPSLLITSAAENEGKTTLSVNLAQVLSQQGKRVLLVDANLRNPEVANALELTEKDGLATALTNQEDPADYIVKTHSFSVLPAGPPVTNPIELLSSGSLAPFFQQAQQNYDVVLVDGPPVDGFAETKALAKEISETILVIKYGATNIDALKRLSEEWYDSDIPLLGAVINFAPAEECAHLRHAKYGPQKNSKKWLRIGLGSAGRFRASTRSERNQGHP